MDDSWTPALIARALDGDSRSLERLFDELDPFLRACVSRTVRRYASARVRADQGVVDDLVQDIGVELLKNNGATLRRWDPSRGSLRTFLARVAFNNVVTWTTRASSRLARQVPDPEEPAVANQARVVDFKKAVFARAELQHLFQFLRQKVSATSWAVFTLKFVDDLSSAEIGAQLDMSQNTVDARISRIRKQIRAWRKKKTT